MDIKVFGNKAVKGLVSFVPGTKGAKAKLSIQDLERVEA